METGPQVEWLALGSTRGKTRVLKRTTDVPSIAPRPTAARTHASIEDPGAAVALVAIARKSVVVIFHVLKDLTPYRELGADNVPTEYS